MTMCVEKRTVRQATADDDLSGLLGNFTLRLNREQILVLDNGERIDGMLVLWDGGHEQLRVDHLVVLPDASANCGATLIEGLMTYCHQHEITDVVFCTPSPEFALKAMLRGGLVTPPMFYVHFPVKEE